MEIDYPCIVINSEDVRITRRHMTGSWGASSWVEDRQGIPRDVLRFNGVMAETIACRWFGLPEPESWQWDSGVDLRISGKTGQVKFRSANHYGLSRPVKTRKMAADCIILAVPGCSYLDRKPFRVGDEICLAGWIGADEFYRVAEQRIFFGKPHLFVDQPLHSMASCPLGGGIDV